MTDWQPIETAPTDGRKVWVKRVYKGKEIAEGWARFGVCDPAAPQRQSLGPDPLGRLTAADYAREGVQRVAYADMPKWLTEDRMYSFPTPTHWRALRLPVRPARIFSTVIAALEPPHAKDAADV